MRVRRCGARRHRRRSADRPYARVRERGLTAQGALLCWIAFQSAMNAPSSTASPGLAAHAQPELAAWPVIRTLVGFDTTSRESNLELIEWVQAHLQEHGISATLTFDDARRKANLFATLPAVDGNARTGGLVLSGHTDVVPVDGQPWTTPPFQATWRGDKVFGRGVADMKSFIATALALVPQWTRTPLSRPLHLALSYDEEVGCVGVRRLIADLVRRGIRPAGAIIGEPTGMEPVIAHKGRQTFRCRVRGHEAHSSLTPHGVNAVQVACEIVTYLTAMGRAFREKGRFDGAYDVPFTTVQTGVIQGGTAVNIVPRECWFDFEMRHLPADDPHAMIEDVKAHAHRLLPEMHAVAPGTGIVFEQLSGLPGAEVSPDHEIVALVKACSGHTTCNKVSFGSEAALFAGAGIPAVLCGPGHIAQAHQPDEWIASAQLERCEAFMRRLVQSCVMNA
jgi:acetylornithine deacetylase